MVKFSVHQLRNGCRIGELLEWCGKECGVKTPTALIFTNTGHVPHLTHEVLNKHLALCQKHIYLLCLPHFLDSLPTIEAYGKRVHSFCGLDDKSLSYLCLIDPSVSLPSGYNANKSSSIWTVGGRRQLNPEQCARAAQTLQTSVHTTLCDYDTPNGCANKRLTKSVKRSAKFNQQTFDALHRNQKLTVSSPFGCLVGGYSNHHRVLSAQDLVKHDFAGYEIVGYHSFGNLDTFDISAVVESLSESLKCLEVSKPRLFCGAFNPTQVWNLCKLGVDLFDSSFTYLLAEKGIGFFLSESFPHNSSFVEIDFNEQKLVDDFSAPFEKCSCYVCQNYTKAYLNHLLNTSEMLAYVLLCIHNLTEYDRMFQKIRNYDDCNS